MAWASKRPLSASRWQAMQLLFAFTGGAAKIAGSIRRWRRTQKGAAVMRKGSAGETFDRRPGSLGVPVLRRIGLQKGGDLGGRRRRQAGILAEVVGEVRHERGPGCPRQQAGMEGVVTGTAFLRPDRIRGHRGNAERRHAGEQDQRAHGRREQRRQGEDRRRNPRRARDARTGNCAGTRFQPVIMARTSDDLCKRPSATTPAI